MRIFIDGITNNNRSQGFEIFITSSCRRGFVLREYLSEATR